MCHTRLCIRTIPPHLINRTVSGCKFVERVAVIFIIFRSPRHIIKVSIPRRQVEGGHGSELTTGVDKVTNHISLSFSPGTLLNSVVRVLWGEKPIMRRKTLATTWIHHDAWWQEWFHWHRLVGTLLPTTNEFSEKNTNLGCIQLHRVKNFRILVS